MATKLTHYELDLNYAAWIDINPTYGNSNLPMRLPNEQSVMYCSLYALLNCPIGDRGGIFEPTYGSDLFWYLQEPICEDTANSIKISIITTFAKWEPRIQLDPGRTTVTANMNLPGYDVHIEGKYVSTGNIESADLSISV